MNSTSVLRNGLKKNNELELSPSAAGKIRDKPRIWTTDTASLQLESSTEHSSGPTAAASYEVITDIYSTPLPVSLIPSYTQRW